jgi:CRP/FNR family transcriptional regulator, cyclic AMP receptor protein
MTFFSTTPARGSTAASEVGPVLEQIFFLKDQPADIRTQLSEITICRTYPKNSLLFHHGDPSDAIYFVISGRVKVCLINEDGREVVLASLQGGLFGLVEALDGPHTGTAITLTGCRLAKITSPRFMAWLRQHPEIHQQLVIGLARMVRSAYEKVGEQALLTAKKRLFSTLVEIARSDGKPTGTDVVFHPHAPGAC